ncbi:MAG: hypothetical protein DRQ44_13825 [Gammaproteobacteria bacterium]|nr:MAG: hypothetical protein DRQ44_13825 [Gammaproteobacteria bacterium]
MAINTFKLALMTIALVLSTNVGASLASNAALLMSPQVTHCVNDAGAPGDCAIGEVPDANYFAIDNDFSGLFEESERTGIEAGLQGGIVLGAVQSLGDIDAAWSISGFLGYHTQAGTISIASDDGEGNVTIDMTGWKVNYNGGDIDLEHGDFATVICGIDCSNGDTFVLEYSSIIPSGTASPDYHLHLSGTISAVPVPAAVWLFGSGLIGLICAARRNNA